MTMMINDAVDGDDDHNDEYNNAADDDDDGNNPCVHVAYHIII